MICNPTPAIDDHNFGPYTPAPPGGFKLGVKNVIFENGPRTPDHLSSPRIFHQAVIVVTKNPDPNADFIADVAAKQARHVDNFRRATRGLAVTDCSLLRDNYRDLYIKHTPADDGTPSSVGDFFDSPDIWVRNSPNGDLNFNSQLPQTGTDNWIYARIRNKGSKPYHNVRVNFYVTTSRTWMCGIRTIGIPMADRKRADDYSAGSVRWRRGEGRRDGDIERSMAVGPNPPSRQALHRPSCAKLFRWESRPPSSTPFGKTQNSLNVSWISRAEA